MKRASRLVAAVLSGVLLIPAGTQGQSHRSASSSTAPAWLEHAWEEDSHVLLYAIGVNDENEIYVTKSVLDAADHYADEGRRPFSYVRGSFIVSYDADGSLRWERPGSTPREETRFFNAFVGYDIVTRDDRIYTSEGTPYTFSDYVPNRGGIMINTYADDGDSLQTIFLGEFPDNAIFPPAAINGLGLDRAGNLYIAGMYDTDSLFFAPHALARFPLIDGFISETGYPDVFMASYTPEGAVRWTRRIGGPLPDWFDGLSVDDDGNTYLLGVFWDGAVFGEGQPNEVRFAPGELDHALVSFTAEGDLRWVRTQSDLGIELYGFFPHLLAVDTAGHLLISWVGPPTKNAGFAGRAATITKHSQDGALLWRRELLAHNVRISSITTDTQGHVYVGGSFSSGPLRLGDTSLHSPDSPNHVPPWEKDGFVAHYDAEGHLRWAGHATGRGKQDITAIAVGPSGDLYVAGKFEETLYLGAEKLEQRGGGLNMFVAKYDASTITSSDPTPELPSTATLTSNYPNPFTHTTTIEYALPASGHVHLSVYDVLGREVATLVDGVQHGGKHTSVFDATSLPSGTYLYRLEASGQVRTGLMTLMK